MTSRHINLFIPGLLGPQPELTLLAPGDIPPLPSLQTFLSRAEVMTPAAQGAQAGLFQLFGFGDDTVKDPNKDLPAAAITRLIDTEESTSQYCLRADPVYIQADRDAAVLLAHEELGLSQDEARQLSETINQHFAEDGWQLHALTPHRWYLSLNQPQQLKTHALDIVMGQDIHPHLPTGKDSPYWHRLLNEIQMLLFNHPINQQREAQGRLTANSVWFWGGGQLPALPPGYEPRWDAVYSQHIRAQGLARLGKIPYAVLPDSAEHLLSQYQSQGRILLTIESIYPFVLARNVFDWLESLQAVNDNWLGVLLDALKRRQCDALSLLAANGIEYRLTRKQLRRWWKPRRSLKHFVN